jgi:predicted nucleic acid-binding protein
VGPARRRPRHDSAPLLIAVTALEHSLTVVSPNLRHFTPTGLATLNPWQAGADG